MLQACKPDSVPLAGCYHLSAMTVASHLYLPTLGRVAPTMQTKTSRFQPALYMAFQHARFTRISPYNEKPWALTPHFHPYPTNRAVIFCGTVSSRRSESPAVSRMRCSMLSGLSFLRFHKTIARLAATAKVHTERSLAEIKSSEQNEVLLKSLCELVLKINFSSSIAK